MRLIAKFSLRLRSIFRRGIANRDLTDELRFHLDRQIAENIAAGMSAHEARNAALREFGGVDQIREECTDMRNVNWLQDLAQDIRHGLRLLRKSPGFTVIAVVTLALGIGANAAIFSMVNALVLRPLPVYAPHEIVSLLHHQQSGGSDNGFSYPDFADIRTQTASAFRDMTAVQLFVMDGFSMNGQNHSMWANFVTTNFFQVMGLQPALGTFFHPSDGKIGSADPVLVLGYSFWKTHLAGDPNIIGKSATVNGRPVTIIGVAPAGFAGIFSILDTQGYLPIGMAAATGDSPKDFITDRKLSPLIIVGRLQHNAKLAQAQPPLAVVARRLSEQYADIHKWDALQALPIGALGPTADSSSSSTINVMAAFFLVLVGLVLVLACMNVANLLLVRASAREREMAVRAALGARRGRLARQLLTESLLLATLGCVGGILLGIAASRSVNSINFASDLPLIFNVSFDWRVFAYALGAAVLTGMLVGLTPAIRAARGDLNSLLHESPRNATARRQRARSALVVAELSGSLMLLIVAGLFVRSLRSVQRSDLGFDPNRVLDLSLAPTEAGYDKTRADEFLKQLVQQAGALPGVESASIAATVPMGYYSYGDSLNILGYEVRKGAEHPNAGFNDVSTDYFRTMRIPLLRGRYLLDSDDTNSQRVAVINEEMARRYWPNQDPLGKTFTTASDTARPIQIVGIVKNTRTTNLTGSYRPYFFRPFAQNNQNPVTLQLRTSLPATTAFHQALGLIHSLAPAMPVFDVQTMTQALDTLNGLLLYQIGAVLTASLGVLGLVLGLVGVYGVVSYAASQRTHEIGIRMALGAGRESVIRMILSQGLIVTGIGVALGALLAAAVGRLASDFLSGVSPVDPLTYACASAILAGVTLTACYIPARRATRVDPMTALRHE